MSVTETTYGRVQARLAPRRVHLERSQRFRARWERWWLAVCALALIVGSEYKWRVRSVSSSLSGQADLSTLIEVGLYAAVALYLLQARSPAPRASRTVPALAWAVAYTAFLSASVLWSPYPVVAAVRATEVVIALLLVWTAYRTATRAHFHRLAHAFVLLTVASIGIGIVKPFPQSTTQAGRFTWLAVHSTTSAIFMGVSVVICLVYLLERHGDTAGVRWRGWVYTLLLVVNLTALLVNHTRGTLAGVIAAVATYAIFSRRPGRSVAGLLGATWLALVVWLAAEKVLLAYIERGSSTEKLLSLNERTSLWTVAFQAFRSEPLFGSGLYASRGIFYDSTGLGGGHNMVVNVMVDLGLCGLLLWAAVVLSLVGRLVVLPSRVRGTSIETDRMILLCIMALLVVNGVTAAGIGGVSNVSFTWLLVAIGWSALLRPPVHPTLRTSPALRNESP